MAAERVCIDCVNFQSAYHLCVRGKRQVGVDPVTGVPAYKYKVCEYAWQQRTSILPWSCGKKGRHFAARGEKGVQGG